MDSLRANILSRREDQWDLVLVASPNTLAVKKYFRDRFELKIAEIGEFVKPGRLLYSDIAKHQALAYQKELQDLGVEVEMFQTGIFYRNKFTDTQIIEALTCLGTHLSEYVIDYRTPCYHLATSFLIIEDNKLDQACMEFLLRYGAPIENIK